MILLPFKTAAIIALLYAGLRGFDHYGTYEVLNFAVCVISLLIAFGHYRNKKTLRLCLFAIIAAVFTQVTKATFYRDEWKIINILTGLIFTASAYSDYTEYKITNRLTDKDVAKEALVCAKDVLANFLNDMHMCISWLLFSCGMCILAVTEQPLLFSKDYLWHIGALIAIAFAVFSGGLKKFFIEFKNVTKRYNAFSRTIWKKFSKRR